MSSGDPAVSRPSSPRASIAGTSRSQESMDPTQISLPPSEAGSVRENEVRDTAISLNAGTGANLDLQSMNIPESASPPPESTEDNDEYKKAMQRHIFLIDVAQNDVRNIILSTPSANTEHYDR
ncbi:hypothetical protein Moror_2405 [Moniliophthora roreri MCA 2997]|uniref:Uncharacterized protein n=1 Tax=Moniliophthora roreri (strain MCA 2997) TaxID=1381753 RepID=V2X042_MONRO|nr:hypothetical protein Moror_2405 [Moniliophthora roreri MCA 2997]